MKLIELTHIGLPKPSGDCRKSPNGMHYGPVVLLVIIFLGSEGGHNDEL